VAEVAAYGTASGRNVGSCRTVLHRGDRGRTDSLSGRNSDGHLFRRAIPARLHSLARPLFARRKMGRTDHRVLAGLRTGHTKVVLAAGLVRLDSAPD